MLTGMNPWRTRAKALWVWEKLLLQDSTLESQGCSEAPGFQIWSFKYCLSPGISTAQFIGLSRPSDDNWGLNLELCWWATEVNTRVIGKDSFTCGHLSGLANCFRVVTKWLQSRYQFSCLLLVTSEWLWPWLLPRCIKNRYRQLIQTSSCKHLGITRVISMSSLE